VSGKTINRPNVSRQSRAEALAFVASELKRRIAEKGAGAFASSHEISGIMTEEYQEFLEAVHVGDRLEIEAELADIAVTAIFGLASIHGEHLDW